MKKIVLGLLVVLVMGMSIGNVWAAPYNYAEALQKALYFYECQQSGPLPAWNRAKQWRGGSCLSDAVTGGWYDAGDHVKFGLPMAYSAAMLGWAMYEYGYAFSGAGQTAALENNLRFVLDYFVKCDQGDSLVYQIGDGGADHSWWGPVEVIEKKMTRPSYRCNASCVTAQTAAALAIGAKVFNDSTYLSHAKSLFNLADSVKSDASYTAANGYYNSWSGFWDELIWAAIWLYIATGDPAYLTKAESYVPNLGKEGQSSDIAYKWTQSWDDCHYGALLLLARITGKEEYHNFLKMHLDWWTAGHNGSRITYTPGGLAWLDSWGSLRYAMNTAFTAFVYSDLITDAALKSRYQNFAISQANYTLGSNPRNSSYVVGFGSNPPQHPHHRTAHGSWCDMQGVPPNHRHILYGALVGGPDSNDGYSDSIGNYTTNEVACDYNAAFVGVLAKMYSLYGGAPLSNFPAAEAKEDEFFVEAGINSSGPTYTEIKALLNNRSGWPARVIKNLSFNYYVDLSEVFAAGYTVSNLTVTTGYQEIPVTLSGLTKYSGNIYYVKITYADGTNIWPGGQSEYAREVQFRIAAPSGSSFWNPANDYSYQSLSNSTTVKTQYITVYDGSTLIYGAEPGQISPSPTPTPAVTPTPTPTPTLTASPTATPVATVTPTPNVTPTPTPSVTPTPTPVVTPTPTPTNETGYAVSYVIINDWGNGATINVSIQNNGTLAVNGWTLAWTFPGNQQITNLWNGSHNQNGAAVTVSDLSYNGTIPANGGTVSFGFNLSYSGSNAKPASFTLNGVPCQVQ